MSRTITLRISDAAYAMVKRYADADQQSMNSWIEDLLDVEDMRRRCAAHGAFMTTRPDMVDFSATWADRSFDELTHR